MTEIGNYTNITPDMKVLKNSVKRKRSTFGIISIFKLIRSSFQTLVIFSLIFCVASHFAPELKESMPQVYSFVENTLFRFLDFIFGILNKLIP